MKIVITPAKRMNDNIDYIDVESLPVFLPQTEELLGILKTLKVDEVKKMLGCNDQIAQIAYLNYQMMDLKKDTVPALLAYEGIQYTNTAAHVLTDDDYEYTKQHLRILSGFYGILRPFDGVVPYRLELKNKVKTEKFKSLYEFWNSRIYDELTKDDNQILDLGAKQYTKIIKKYLTSSIKYVKCHFKEESDEGYREIGVYVKMARGQMVRYLIENRIDSFEAVKQFNYLGYQYCEALSDVETYVFIRKKGT